MQANQYQAAHYGTKEQALRKSICCRNWVGNSMENGFSGRQQYVVCFKAGCLYILRRTLHSDSLEIQLSPCQKIICFNFKSTCRKRWVESVRAAHTLFWSLWLPEVHSLEAHRVWRLQASLKKIANPTRQIKTLLFFLYFLLHRCLLVTQMGGEVYTGAPGAIMQSLLSNKRTGPALCKPSPSGKSNLNLKQREDKGKILNVHEFGISPQTPSVVLKSELPESSLAWQFSLFLLSQATFYISITLDTEQLDPFCLSSRFLIYWVRVGQVFLVGQACSHTALRTNKKL